MLWDGQAYDLQGGVTMGQHKRFAAFISFAEPDKELAELIRDLFYSIDTPVYTAPSELPEAGTPEWRQAIIRAIRESSAFVPIYTRHSLRRPWVLYESGVADAFKLPRFPALVSSISKQGIADLPSRDAFIYDLWNDESIANLLTNVTLQQGGER